MSAQQGEGLPVSLGLADVTLERNRGNVNTSIQVSVKNGWPNMNSGWISSSNFGGLTERTFASKEQFYQEFPGLKEANSAPLNNVIGSKPRGTFESFKLPWSQTASGHTNFGAPRTSRESIL
jgi:hypothetical protein